MRWEGTVLNLTVNILDGYPLSISFSPVLSVRHYCLVKANSLEGPHGLPYGLGYRLPCRLPYMVYPAITLALSLKIQASSRGRGSPQIDTKNARI